MPKDKQTSTARPIPRNRFRKEPLPLPKEHPSSLFEQELIRECREELGLSDEEIQSWLKEI